MPVALCRWLLARALVLDSVTAYGAALKAEREVRRTLRAQEDQEAAAAGDW